jgi:2-oxoglutarate/2-oxoacid ferredoxin oxidoreductase subunit alpha
MQENDRTIVIGGEAGQGLVTVGTLLSKILTRSGYRIVVNQDYQSRVRGGHNSFAIRVVDGDAFGPGEAIDLLVAMDSASVDIHRQQMAERSVVIIDEAFGIRDGSFLAVPYRDLAEKQYENTVALGVLGVLLGLPPEAVAKSLDETFGKKNTAVLEANRRVLAAATRWAAGQSTEVPRLAPVSPKGLLMMNGNDGIAFGALTAGVRFCSFYPMTPSTSIALTLAGWGQAAGIAVEQAEDEIAAINMAIGASYAGAPAIVPTSGGGFALMVEGVALAGMTETPVVVVVGQRPGPATGLPTRTEQGELMFVISAGHGEFPRAVFAPGDVEECVHLTRKAFEAAARFQGPVFVLTDQYLADSYRAVEPFAIDGLGAVASGIADAEDNASYRRYEITEDGVSPRLLPGTSEGLVVVDSDEHTEDGHITEDLGVRERMVDKRLGKSAGIAREVVGPCYSGPEKPELLLVSWGSTKGAVLEAARTLRDRGIAAATLTFSQVWPLVSDQFKGYLMAAGEVVVVEGNATGQFAGLIAREAGFAAGRKVLRYDGLPITARFIIDRIARQEGYPHEHA